MYNIIKRIKSSYTYSRFMAQKHQDHEYIINYLRSIGIAIGNNCKIYTKIYTPEAYLISIGNDVTISANVTFITHDNSISKVLPEFTDVFGRIIIGDNCFIGQNATILPGVTLGNNIIVAAGSVVTKSFHGNVVIGGNPAKIITSVDNYKAKCQLYGHNVNGLSCTEKKTLLINSDKLVNKKYEQY